MNTVKIFVQKACQKCPQAKQTGADLQQLGWTVFEYDVQTAEGLAEAAFYGIKATPSFIVEDSGENVLGDFRGQVPELTVFNELCSRTVINDRAENFN